MAPPEVDLHALGARVVSVFGAFDGRVLIEMSSDHAAPLFPGGLGASGRSNVIEAVERDVESLRVHAPDLADSGLAAIAVQLAYELEHPFNSATSKSMCAKALLDVMNRLRELAPPKQESDQIDDLAAKRIARRAKFNPGGPAAEDSPRT